MHTEGGLVLSETSYAAGVRVPAHCHEHAYLCLIRRGVYREEYAGRSRMCGARTLAFHPAGELHAEEIGPAEVRSFNVEVSPGWLRTLTGAPISTPSFDTCDGRMVGLALRLLEEFDSPDVSSPLIVTGLTLELLGQASRPVRRARLPPGWLARLREWIDEHCTEPLRLQELAAEAGIGPSCLAEAFRRHFGCSVGTYVRRQRVARACRYLTAPAPSLAEIALRTGFADQSHFTRIFNREVGCTPAQFRRSGAAGPIRSKV